MSKTVELDSRMNYESMLRAIGRLGVLRVDNHFERNGIKVVTLHERTVTEWFKEKFNPGIAKASRQAAEAALVCLVATTARRHEQLVQNIHDRTAQGIDITGRAIARDYQRVSANRNPLPLQGGTVVARGKGRGVQVINVPAQKIRCEHAILRDTTALGEIATNKLKTGEYHQLRNWRLNPAENFSDDAKAHDRQDVSGTRTVGLAARTWTCVSDAIPARTGAGKAGYDAAQVEQMIEAALKGKSGAVVLEPLPDQCVDMAGELAWSYSDEGLRAQARAARKAVRNTKDDLVITFACADQDVLQRMQALGVARDKPEISG